jgi:hypothetical protein
MKRRCSWPGCRNLDPRIERQNAVRGRCSRHGEWTACKRHRPTQSSSLNNGDPYSSPKGGDRVGYFVTEDSLALERARSTCPVCLWERSEASEEQRRADEAEAERRNAEERKRPDPPNPMVGWIAEFQAQGYSRAAAEALASKRWRESPPVVSPSRKEWTAYDIASEREAAERQRKVDAGEIGVCPVCKMHVLVSQDIVLKHGSYVDNYNEWTGRGTANWQMCTGEGSQVAHPA